MFVNYADMTYLMNQTRYWSGYDLILVSEEIRQILTWIYNVIYYTTTSVGNYAKNLWENIDIHNFLRQN